MKKMVLFLILILFLAGCTNKVIQKPRKTEGGIDEYKNRRNSDKLYDTEPRT